MADTVEEDCCRHAGVPQLLLGPPSRALERHAAALAFAECAAGPVRRLMDTLDCLSDAEHQLRHAQQVLLTARLRAQKELLNCEKVATTYTDQAVVLAGVK